MDAELIAKEHEAGKKSVEEVLKFTKRERNEICNKICNIQAGDLMDSDEKLLKYIPEHREIEFEKKWNSRKLSLTKHAKFCLFTTTVKQLAGDLDELMEAINVKSNFEENVASVTSSQGKSNSFLSISCYHPVTLKLNLQYDS